MFRLRLEFLLPAMVALLPGLRAEPGPGDIFREYVWAKAYPWQRITDPDAKIERARQFLPNAVNTVELADLEGATRVAVQLELLQSHSGTAGQALRFNGGEWIPIPPPDGIPGNLGARQGSSDLWLTMLYPIVHVPRSMLKQGANTFEFTCRAGLNGLGTAWPQSIVYGVIFRIYYGPDKPAPAGRVAAPVGTAGRFGTIELVAEPVAAPGRAIRRVDFFANYRGYDWRGEGVYQRWHYHTLYGGLRRHAGTAFLAPWRAAWDVRDVPAQEQPVQVVARIEDDTGLCRITEPLILGKFMGMAHTRMFTAHNIPHAWQSRAGRGHSCTITLPDDLSGLQEAKLILASWNGHQADAIGINSTILVQNIGHNHDLSYDEITIPVSALKPGKNEFHTTSSTQHHGIEVLWPGAVIIARFARLGQRIETKQLFHIRSAPAPVGASKQKSVQPERPMKTNIIRLFAVCCLVPAIGTQAVAQDALQPVLPARPPAEPAMSHFRIMWMQDPAEKAMVSWTTPTEGTSHVVYYDTEPRQRRLSAYAHRMGALPAKKYRPDDAGPPEGWAQHALLENLTPATTYYFVVVSDGRISREFHFITAPDDDRLVKLLYGGDSRRPPALPAPHLNRRAINRLIASLVEEQLDIIAFAHGGDYCSSTQWRFMSDWLSDHELTITKSGRILPIIPTRGNHESLAGYHEVFFWPERATYYSTALSRRATLITLDTQSSIAGDQRDWLEAELVRLRKDPEKWIVLQYHVPAYPSVKAWERGAQQRQHWVPLFQEHQVDLVCEADDHMLKRTVPIYKDKHDPQRGIIYIGDGGLGVPQRVPDSTRWYLKSPGFATPAHHVHLIEFANDEIRTTAIGLEREFLDRFTVKSKTVPAALSQ